MSTAYMCFAWDGIHRIEFFHATDRITRATPETEYRAHTHNCCELYLFVKGPPTDYVVENNLYHLSPGDIILTREGELHHARFLGEGDYECFYFKIVNDCFEKLSSRMQSPLWCFRERPFGCDNLLTMPEEEQRLVMRTCYQMLQERNLPYDTSRALCFSYVMLILATVNRAYARGNTAPSGQMYSPLMREILNYVNTNISGIQNAAQVSSRFSITPSYFSRLFRSGMNITFTKYLRSKKIALAKLLLIQGSNVTDACFESGFEDYSYFISTFHKETGMTPLQYQKKIRDKND